MLPSLKLTFRPLKMDGVGILSRFLLRFGLNNRGEMAPFKLQGSCNSIHATPPACRSLRHELWNLEASMRSSSYDLPLPLNGPGFVSIAEIIRREICVSGWLLRFFLIGEENWEINICLKLVFWGGNVVVVFVSGFLMNQLKTLSQRQKRYGFLSSSCHTIWTKKNQSWKFQKLSRIGIKTF